MVDAILLDHRGKIGTGREAAVVPFAGPARRTFDDPSCTEHPTMDDFDGRSDRVPTDAGDDWAIPTSEPADDPAGEAAALASDRRALEPVRGVLADAGFWAYGTEGGVQVRLRYELPFTRRDDIGGFVRGKLPELDETLTFVEQRVLE